MKVKIELTGLEELAKKLRDNCSMEDVKSVVKQNGAEMQSKMMREANFVKGYQTGTTKQSIGLDIRDGGFTAASGPSTEYSEYLEHGTRFMEAQPFVGPAYNAQKVIFERDMEKLVK